MTHGPEADMPVTDMYFDLLREAQTPEDVAALIAMHAEDEAVRLELLSNQRKGTELVALPDGTVEAAATVMSAIRNHQQGPSLYDNSGRRA